MHKSIKNLSQQCSTDIYTWFEEFRKKTLGVIDYTVMIFQYM